MNLLTIFRPSFRVVGLALAASLSSVVLVSASDNLPSWSQQGGPNRDAIITEETVSPDFKDTDGKVPVLWQTSVGFGSAPVVVQGNFVYTYGVVKPGTKPEDVTSASAVPSEVEISDSSNYTPGVDGYPGRKDWPFTPQQVDWKSAPEDILPTTPIPPSKDSPWEHVKGMYRGDLYAYCLDATTGKPVWTTLLTDWGLLSHGHDCWPIGSPLLAKGKLYIHSQNGQLYCLNATDGKLVWHESLFKHQMTIWWNKQCNACAPLLYGSTVMVCYLGANGGDDQGMLLGCFDAETGAEKWVTKTPIDGFRNNNTTISMAKINDEPTVLMSLGRGTVGVDPETGKVRWSFNVYDSNPDTMLKLPDEYKSEEGGYMGNLMFPYSSYAPVAWKNYVMDATNTGHDTVTSKTWCIQIDNDQAKQVWTTNVGVPMSECEKGNMIAKDGKLYLLDATGTDPAQVDKTPTDGKSGWTGPCSRILHGGNKDAGSFQCYDIATGKLLWSSNELGGVNRYNRSNMIMVGDTLILNREGGIWIAKIGDKGLTVQAHIRGSFFELAEPVVAGGHLYLRSVTNRNFPQIIQEMQANLGDNTLYCIDLTK